MTTYKREKIITESKKFILANYKTAIKIVFALFLLYWILYILTPNIKMSADSKEKIDALNTQIDSLEAGQKRLDENIKVFNQEIIKVDKKISNIKQEKTIIKEIYHEKITDVDNYTDDELDSFFAKRYGYTR
jgi:exonuclease VII small subunit